MSTLDRPRPTPATDTVPLSLAPLSDAALANLIANGRDGAFEVLYERYRGDLSRYCRALLRNPEDAEEAFQGTMLNALRALRSGEGGRTMRPWLYRIAHNQCASMIRARRPSSALNPEQPSPADPPEDQVAIAEQIRHLRSDLGSLPALQRSALVMREMSGLSHRAIAQALAVEPADARQLVYEARRSLDECRIGREAGCGEVRAQIADGDRRRLRGRRVKAHLRDCDHCSAYVASQDERRRGYAALAPAMPAAAGRQVYDRVMGSSGAATSGGGGAVLGIPGGVAGTIAGFAAGLNPGTSAKAWARLPEGTATGLAGAGATAGIALLSLALTALLLSGDNAAHGSSADAPAASAPTPLQVIVAAPPGAADIGYRVTRADSTRVVPDARPAAPAPDAVPGPAPAPARQPTPTVGTATPDGPIIIEIRGVARPEREIVEAPVSDGDGPAGAPGLEVAELPPEPSTAPPAPQTPPAPAEAVVDSPVPAPEAAAEITETGSPAEPTPTPATPAPIADVAAPVTPVSEELPPPSAAAPAPSEEVGSVPDPEPLATAPIAASAPSPVDDPTRLADGEDPDPTRDQDDGDEESDVGDTDRVAEGAGSGPDPEPVPDETESTDAEGDNGQAVSDEVGSEPDPEPDDESEPESDGEEREIVTLGAGNECPAGVD